MLVFRSWIFPVAQANGLNYTSFRVVSFVSNTQILQAVVSRSGRLWGFWFPVQVAVGLAVSDSSVCATKMKPELVRHAIFRCGRRNSAAVDASVLAGAGKRRDRDGTRGDHQDASAGGVCGLFDRLVSEALLRCVWSGPALCGRILA